MPRGEENKKDYIPMRKILLALLLLATITHTRGDGFNLIVVGDPQPQTEEQIARLERDIVPQIGAIVEEYLATGYPTAILLTGDIVWDTMAFLPRVKSMFESLGVPVYAVVGNHDHPADIFDNERVAERYFEAAFGRRYYSFTLGDTHFVALDNICYSDHDNYTIDIDRKQLRWLRRDLRKVDTEQRIAIAMHAPVVNYRKGEILDYANEIIDIVGDRELHFITGHRHRHATADISPRIIEHSVAQVNGNLWFAPICSDGTPRGVFCIEERDNEWRWQHRILGKEPDYQLVTWHEGIVADNEEYVVTKVIGWDSMWRVEWLEDGIAMGAMEQIEIVDPDYMHYVEHEADYGDVIMSRLRRSAYPHKHYFRCRRTRQNSEITIVATDRFGRVFTHVVGS